MKASIQLKKPDGTILAIVEPKSIQGNLALLRDLPYPNGRISDRWNITHIPTGGLVWSGKAPLPTLRKAFKRLAAEIDWDFDKQDSPKLKVIGPLRKQILEETVYT